MSDTLIAEHLRRLLPDIAAPIAPGEGVRSWLERAAKKCGLPAARIRGYWHRKIEAPKATEYLAIIDAAEAAHRRQQAIMDMEADIARRVEELRRERQEIVEGSSVLAGVLPAAPRYPTAGKDAA